MTSRAAFARRPAAPVWIGAICLALALHAAGFALAFARLPHDEADEAGGVPALEVSLELTAPHHEDLNLPPGPEADSATASSASMAQTAKVETTELLKEQPTETTDAERVVSPEAAKETKEEAPKVTKSEASAAPESVASEAAAPPPIPEAREATVTRAPVLGAGASARAMRATWQRQLITHINRFKRYPSTGSRRTVEIVVAFTLDRSGHVISAAIQTGSGDPAFDHAALAMMEKADPVPPPPPPIADEGLSFSLPVVFRSKGR